MTMVSDLTQELRDSRFRKSVRRESKSLLVLVNITMKLLTTSQRLELLILIWVHLHLDQIQTLLLVQNSKVLQVNMTMASALTQVLRVSKSKRREKKELQ